MFLFEDEPFTITRDEVTLTYDGERVDSETAARLSQRKCPDDDCLECPINVKRRWVTKGNLPRNSYCSCAFLFNNSSDCKELDEFLARLS